MGQWAWPINLPVPFRVDAYITGDEQRLPWGGEIAHALLRPPAIGIGPANEVVRLVCRWSFRGLRGRTPSRCVVSSIFPPRTQVFFHKRSKTLVVTDLVVFIDGARPSEVVEVPDLLKAALDDPDR